MCFREYSSQEDLAGHCLRLYKSLSRQDLDEAMWARRRSVLTQQPSKNSTAAKVDEPSHEEVVNQTSRRDQKTHIDKRYNSFVARDTFRSVSTYFCTVQRESIKKWRLLQVPISLTLFSEWTKSISASAVPSGRALLVSDGNARSRSLWSPTSAS